jgi:preprotein translocase subunit SecD
MSSEGESYLESKIYLFLDGKDVNNLSIGSGLAKKSTSLATVSGAANSISTAKEEKIFLQTVLQSGALPVELKIVSLQSISPKLGQNFLNYTAIAFIVAIIVVSGIVLVRYRHLAISSLVVLTCLSEIIIILGSSVVIGWTLDLAAIAGIIAVVGTGVDQQIMIVDEILMGERTWTMKSKIRRALFIVFGTAGTVLAAMLPLMLLGFGMLRGFAMTTSLGVLIAIFITRPAFTAMMEKIINK